MKKLPRMDAASIQDDVDSLFKDVVFMVEADSFASHYLWLTRHHTDVGLGHVESWKEEGMGHTCVIGLLDKRPINLVFFYAKIEGRRVCFWHATSQVIDTVMIDKWMEPRIKHMRWDHGTRPATCDAMNFHHCLDAIREMNR